MQDVSDELIPTRASLLARIKNLEDHDSWQDFFDTYSKLIFGVAMKRGLSSAEAQDVVQETMCAAMKHMPNFNYDRTVGSFKTWLLNMVKWRIADQFRKRPAVKNLLTDAHVDADAVLHNIPDNNDFEAIWDQQWEQALFDAAIVKTRRKVDPQKFQMFDLLIKQRLSPAQIAETFHISVDQVYLVKHRVTEQIRSEVERLKQHVI